MEWLPFGRIESNARFAIYSEAEGLVSEHERARESMRGLSAHLKKNTQTTARIYERTLEGWEAIL
jgi:hypothetical protein